MSKHEFGWRDVIRKIAVWRRFLFYRESPSFQIYFFLIINDCFNSSAKLRTLSSGNIPVNFNKTFNLIFNFIYHPANINVLICNILLKKKLKKANNRNFFKSNIFIWTVAAISSIKNKYYCLILTIKNWYFHKGTIKLAQLINSIVWRDTSKLNWKC